MEPLFSLLCFSGGLAFGAILTWAALRQRNQGVADSARSESQVELATQRARLEAAESARTQLSEELRAERQQLQSLHEQLRTLGQRSGVLEEQAAQVPKLDRALSSAVQESAVLKGQLADLREKFGSGAKEAELQARRIGDLSAEKEALSARRDALERESAQLREQQRELGAVLESERRQSAEKLQLLQEAREHLANHFKTLANEIFEERGRRFAEQNHANLSQILDPLRSRLQEFQGKVEEVYVREGKDRAALAEQVRHLMQLNQQLSSDANNLTQALRSEAKVQGGWGELLLERLLEASGLMADIHYQAQVSESRSDGSRAQPDVVVHLPEGRKLVIDAKVSLTAYAEYAAATQEEERAAAIGRHLLSIRAHLVGLAERNYHELYGQDSLDFVVMFVPIEPAFTLALVHDEKLWMEAWQRNVLLVGPSTLLFVVRIVAQLWRQEQQSRNVQDIAKRGAELYDKLASFVADLEKVGDRLRQAQDSYDDALKKLSSGKGNALRQAEMLRELGVRPTKALPPRLLGEDAPALPPPPAP